MTKKLGLLWAAGLWACQHPPAQPRPQVQPVCYAIRATYPRFGPVQWTQSQVLILDTAAVSPSVIRRPLPGARRAVFMPAKDAPIIGETAWLKTGDSLFIEREDYAERSTLLALEIGDSLAGKLHDSLILIDTEFYHEIAGIRTPCPR